MNRNNLQQLLNQLNAIRQYIGARYIPKFIDDPWSDTIEYEALSVVNVSGTSYISGETVPVGTPITDRNYWHLYGASSGAIINLQNQIDDMKDPDVSGSLQAQINDNASDIQDLASNKVNTSDIENNLNVTISGKVLDARQGKVLNDALMNEISTRQNDVAGLTSDISNEALVRASADSALSARIDNIVAPSGEAPSTAEILDARVGVNGVTYTSLGDAIRGQIGEADALIENVQDNAFDYIEIAPAVINTGYIVNLSNPSSTYTSSTSCYTKTLIPTGVKKLKVSGATAGVSYGYGLIGFYKSDNTLISRYNGSDNTQYTDYQIDVPDDTAYVLVNFYQQGTTYIPVKGFSCIDVKNLKSRTIRLEGFKDDVEDNLFVYKPLEANVVTDGYIVNLTNPSTTYSSGSSHYTKTVLPSGTSKLRVSGHTADVDYGYGLIAFFDVNGVRTGIFRGISNTAYTDYEIDVPLNTNYVLVNFYQSDVEDIKIYCCINFNGNDKKFIFLGDSITSLGTGERGWIRYFKEKILCQVVANVAVSSATMNDDANTVLDGNPTPSSNNTLCNQVQKIINNNYDTPDVIIIMIGTNGGISITTNQLKDVYVDGNGDLIPITNVDRKTSAGAFRWAETKLHELYPHAKIYWCTPIMRASRLPSDVISWAESLKRATDYVGSMCVPTYQCGINKFNETEGAPGEDLIDGLHPTKQGAKKIGEFIAGYLREFI